jgi:bacterioferritin (cytochrome b1)
MSDEEMDVQAQIEALNKALRLQQRSLLQYALTAGSITGIEYKAHADQLREFAGAELPDMVRLVEKVTALGGQPSTEVAEISWADDPVEQVDNLIEAERETLKTMQAAIEPTGREAASEAVEHRLEHMIMRKQEQVDYLLRAQRRPGE